MTVSSVADRVRRAGFPLLLSGPRGSGKWDLLVEVASGLGQPRLFRQPSMEQAREIVALYEQRPIFGSSKVVSVIGLDGVSAQVQNALLKTLEDPGDWKVMLLCCSGSPLRTVVSRCRRVRMDGLSAEVLVDRVRDLGLSPALTSVLVGLCGGAPGRVEFLARLWPKRGRAVSLVQALARRDRLALVDLSRSWDADDWLAVRRWCLEVLADWPQCFSHAELVLADSLGRAAVYRLVAAADISACLEAVALDVWRGES